MVIGIATDINPTKIEIKIVFVSIFFLDLKTNFVSQTGHGTWYFNKYVQSISKSNSLEQYGHV
jgi:hypothetical protein